MEVDYTEELGWLDFAVKNLKRVINGSRVGSVVEAASMVRHDLRLIEKLAREARRSPPKGAALVGKKPSHRAGCRRPQTCRAQRAATAAHNPTLYSIALDSFVPPSPQDFPDLP